MKDIGAKDTKFKFQETKLLAQCFDNAKTFQKTLKEKNF